MPHRRRTPCALSPVFESMEARLLLDGTPLVTEFMAINGSTLTDSNGVYSDWIEIYNPTEEAVSLNGWRLTDDPGWLTQWTFPDVSLGAGEYLIVFASGTADPPVAGQELHTNFVLDGSNGEYLALVKPTPSPTAADVVTEYTFPPQVEDVSFGLTTDYDVTTILPAGAGAATLIP
ncbi:MAG: lamin tail domain-containing protein, partial [Planctomycetes bacterium]|nr:lamin tail domain-containing protein [Planctomycetota bacterium]